MIAAFVVLGGVVSVFNPLFEATDEIRHYRYVRILVTEHRLPVQGEEPARAVGHHPPLYYTLSALLSGWIPSSHDVNYHQPGNPFWGYRDWAVGVDNKLQYWHSPAERIPFREGYLATMVPRWVNVLIGASTVAVTYLLAYHVVHRRTALALGAAALVAFNPQFIYLSAAINNDILAGLMGSAVLLACVAVVQQGATSQRVGILGLVYALALLTKLHLAAMGVVIAMALAMEAVRHSEAAVRTPRHVAVRWLRHMMLVGAIAVVLAGWWYARNFVLYGDPTGINRMNEMWAGREAKGNFWAVRQGLPYLWSSLWGRFGYGQIPLPSAITTGLFVVCGLGLAGLVRTAVRGSTKEIGAVQQGTGRSKSVLSDRDPDIAILGLLALTVMIFLGVVGYYMMIQPAGAMGRFLFPALPAFAVLLIAGLDGWIGRPRVAGIAVSLGMALIAVTALIGYVRPAVSYPQPMRRATHATTDVGTINVQVGDVARILAVNVTPKKVHPGTPIFVEVIWEPQRWTDIPYAVYVHLIDEAGVLVAQRDTWPGLGRAPTTSWRADVAFRDTYRIDLPTSLYSPNQLTAVIGLYAPERGRLPILTVDGQANGEAASDALIVGKVEVLSAEGPWPNTMAASFDDQVALVGYTLTPRVAAPGETVALTLYWDVLTPQMTEATSPQVFAQVLDNAFNVWGSHDGGHPSWAEPGIVTETRKIMLLPETPPGSYPVQVGLFTGDGRLPVVAENGRRLDERALLGPILVATK